LTSLIESKSRDRLFALAKLAAAKHPPAAFVPPKQRRFADLIAGSWVDARVLSSLTEFGFPISARLKRNDQQIAGTLKGRLDLQLTAAKVE
jgi:hypothetical protein